MSLTPEKCKVLVVDDEPGMCRGIERSLRNHKVKIDEQQSEIYFNIDYVLSKNAFLEVISKEKYDIVFLDYKMPDVKGLELVEKIVKTSPNTLVIMMTAFATFETAVQSIKLGAYDFLAKPFSTEELKDSINKAARHFTLAQKAKKFEEEKKKIRFQFISVLSHELKAPLNAIEGYVDILQNYSSKLSEEEVSNMLSRCKIRIDGMRKLILDLLDLTKIESGDKERKFETVRIYDLVKSSIDLFYTDACKRNITIDSGIDKNITFNCDPSEIEIILNNLISNAIKYNKENGKVIIRVKHFDNKTQVTVADTGIGIAKKDMSRLFKEFSRIKNEKTLQIVGSGLGLSTINKIINLYNGKINVKSKENAGSVFKVVLG